MPSQSVEDLRKALADAEAAEADINLSPAAANATADTSGMPGGVDSAPVTDMPPVSVEDPAMQPGGAAANTASAGAPAAAEPAPLLERVEQDAEQDAVDIIGELKSGASISSVANKLLDQNGLASIVKAIGELAGKVL